LTASVDDGLEPPLARTCDIDVVPVCDAIRIAASVSIIAGRAPDWINHTHG